ETVEELGEADPPLAVIVLGTLQVARTRRHAGGRSAVAGEGLAGRIAVLARGHEAADSLLPREIAPIAGARVAVRVAAVAIDAQAVGAIGRRRALLRDADPLGDAGGPVRSLTADHQHVPAADDGHGGMHSRHLQ